VLTWIISPYAALALAPEAVLHLIGGLATQAANLGCHDDHCGHRGAYIVINNFSGIVESVGPVC
jgi:hypothetical protein